MKVFMVITLGFVKSLGKWNVPTSDPVLGGLAACVKALTPELLGLGHASEVVCLDAPGEPFWDPEADHELFAEVERQLEQTPDRQVKPVPWHINHPCFAQAVLDAFQACVTRP